MKTTVAYRVDPWRMSLLLETARKQHVVEYDREEPSDER